MITAEMVNRIVRLRSNGLPVVSLYDLLDRMAAGLGEGNVQQSAADWLGQARSPVGEIREVDDALRQAEESVRLNPPSGRLPLSTTSLRRAMETLEHEAIAIRVLARSLADGAWLPGSDNPFNDAQVRHTLADVLRELAAAFRTHGGLATQFDAHGHEMLPSEMEHHLTAAQQQQDLLSELMRTDPATRPVGWPLRGELISRLDRLRSELQTGKADSNATQRRGRLFFRAAHSDRQRRLAAWRRQVT